MSYSIDLDKERSFISVKLWGDLSPESALEHFGRLLEKIKDSNVARVITDASNLVLTNPIEDYQFIAQKLREMDFPTELKRAILIAEDTPAFKTWENFMFKGGYHRVKLFWQEEMAMEWLLA